jgi:hypothetical protein
VLRGVYEEHQLRLVARPSSLIIGTHTAWKISDDS